jgi:acyl carrier protein
VPADDSAGPPLAARLAHLPEAERERAVLDLVLDHTARVLGHPSPEEVDPEAAFLSLGFDSLTSLELRTRLNNAAALHLPATVVFEYPAPAALAAHLLEQLASCPTREPQAPEPQAPEPQAPEPRAPAPRAPEPAESADPLRRADNPPPTPADIDRLAAAVADAAPGELVRIGASLERLMAAWTSRTSDTA